MCPSVKQLFLSTAKMAVRLVDREQAIFNKNDQEGEYVEKSDGANC